MKDIRLGYITKNENQFDDLGEFKSRLLKESITKDDSFTRIRVIKYKDKQKLKDVRNEAYKNERTCDCSHDCCGHWQSAVYSVIRIKSKVFRIETTYYQNV